MEEIRDNTGTHAALKNDLVLTTIFDLLDAKDLQSCRLVCSKWEQISRSYFAKRSKLFIAGDENPQVLDTFTETFSGASVMPFTKFCFKGSFPDNKFEEIFNSWPTITELFLESLVLADTDGNITEEYGLNNSNFLNLRTLSYKSDDDIFKEYPRKTELVVHLSKIRSIKNLYLNGPCFLHFDYRICPDELSFEGEVRFVREEKPMELVFCLNDFINLKNVRKLGVTRLVSSTFFHYDLTVDLTDCQRLENLSHNWGTLVGLSPQTKIKELRINTPCDLSLLPVHLERLEFWSESVTRYHFSCTGEVNLPHLKHLYTENGFFLHKFLNCPNLTDMIIGHRNDFYHYHMVQIPARVSRLFLHLSHHLWPSRPKNMAPLDYLHLELPVWDYHCGQALEILERLQTQTLVISFKLEARTLLLSHHRRTQKRGQASKAELMKIVDLQSARGGTVALGGIEWDVSCESFLARVDRKSEFYFFTNGEGRTIEKVEFENFIQLTPDSVYFL